MWIRINLLFLLHMEIVYSLIITVTMASPISVIGHWVLPFAQSRILSVIFDSSLTPHLQCAINPVVCPFKRCLALTNSYYLPCHTLVQTTISPSGSLLSLPKWALVFCPCPLQCMPKTVARVNSVQTCQITWLLHDLTWLHSIPQVLMRCNWHATLYVY